MKRKIIYLAIAIFIGLASVHAQTACSDTNKYVNYKNAGSTGAITLTQGTIEKAAQTYLYSGPGKISSVRIYGSYTTPFPVGGVPLRVKIYNVDANGRPISALDSANVTWWWYNNPAGYVDVPFSNAGVPVSHNFAVGVELRTAMPWGTSFNLRYTGNGDGKGQDLASLAGSQTGNNWSSAKNDFIMDGDFYLVPNVINFITSNFSVSSQCIAISTPVTFTNTTQMSVDSQFNTIGLSTYSGGSHYYTWNFGDNSAVSYTTNPSHSFATAGVYTVTLTSTFAGWTHTCTDVKTMRISVGLSASADSIVNEKCNKTSIGSIFARGAGGSGNYTYSLNNDGYQAGQHFGELPAGEYTLYVKDDLGCINQASFGVTEPSALVFAPVATTSATCGHSDGAILASASGGTGAIQYQLGSGAFQSGGSYSNQAGGTYVVTVKDANNCTASVSAAVSNADGPNLSITSRTNVSCSNGADGSIVLQGTGGSGVLQYSINGGASYQVSGSFLNKAAGTYGAIVKDANGCTQSTIVILTQPSALSLKASTVKPRCHGGNDGQINITSAVGGTGTFSYSINGTDYQSGTTFSGLSAGTYTVHVKDVAGCTATTQAVVTEPAILTASATAVTPASCYGSFNGSFVITASGGTGRYSYNISGSESQHTNTFSEVPAGVYTVYVTDENLCEASATATITQPTAISTSINATASTCGNSNGGFLATASGGSGSGYQYSINDTLFNSNGSFSGLSSGTYYVITQDGSGCINMTPASVVDANGPTITGNSFTNVSCNGGSDGSITVTGVTGGTGTLLYSSNGGQWQTSPLLAGLAAGSYTITVKDANGCRSTVTQTLTEPNGFVINTSLSNVACNGGTSGAATIYASGGSGVFAYTIDNGATYQSSNTFSGLDAGRYTVIVRDAAGCNSRVPFILTQPSRVTFNTGVLNVSCAGASNGAIAIYPSGGIGQYKYSLNGTTYQNTSYFSNLSGQYYLVYVKDSNNCVTTNIVLVGEPAALVVTPSVSNVSCAGGHNGSIALEVDGGTLPNTFKWSNDAYTQNIFNLAVGTYYVTVVDANGCIVRDSNIVTQPAQPLVVNGVVVNDAGGNSGAITITVTGGDAPYSFLWSNQATTQSLAGLGGGSYSVNVSDANGCISSGSFSVAPPLGITNVNGDAISVDIYPNPSSQMATIEVKGAKITSMRVLSIAGTMISESEPDQSIVQINSEALAAGVYLVQMRIDGNLVTRRMVVDK